MYGVRVRAAIVQAQTLPRAWFVCDCDERGRPNRRGSLGLAK